MKALSISQPWAWAIVHASKRIENRDWKPPAAMVGQIIAIHAAKSWQNGVIDFINDAIEENFEDTKIPELNGLKCPPNRADHVAGAIIGTAKIIAVYDNDNLEDLPDHQEIWFQGSYGWRLQEVKPLLQPVPCRGALGLWDVPADILALMQVQS